MTQTSEEAGNQPENSYRSFQETMESHPYYQNGNVRVVSWDVEDILGYEISENIHAQDFLTRDVAKDLLQAMVNKHDASIGLNWDVLGEWVSSKIYELREFRENVANSLLRQDEQAAQRFRRLPWLSICEMYEGWGGQDHPKLVERLLAEGVALPDRDDWDSAEDVESFLVSIGAWGVW